MLQVILLILLVAVAIAFVIFFWFWLPYGWLPFLICDLGYLERTGGQCQAADVAFTLYTIASGPTALLLVCAYRREIAAAAIHYGTTIWNCVSVGGGSNNERESNGATAISQG